MLQRFEVKIPNPDTAIIEEEKLSNYLLNPTHRRGGSKAKQLLSMGYSCDEWQRLEADLRNQHLIAEVDRQSDSDDGKRYEIVAPLRGPNGGQIAFRSIWQIDIGTDRPRLITIHPE